MTTLREAAQQALKVMESAEVDPHSSDAVYKAITALKAALAEPVQEPVAWMMVNETYATACERRLRWTPAKDWHPTWEAVPLYTATPRCPNCASLEAQNTELDRKLADLEQTSLELCETCGWRTLIPGEGCLNCARSKPLTIERLRDALVASRIIPPAAVEDPDEYDDGVTLFRIEALHRRIT